MARLPRFFLPRHPQHVIQRGNNRTPIFLRTQDYEFFLDCLYHGRGKYGGEIHAYVLMTNHIHMLMTPDKPHTIPKILQSAGRRYVRYFNDTYERTGTLWEGRYRATIIDSAHYLLSCYRYIELNPVRAGLVSHPGSYRWSSYRCHARGEYNRLITDHDLYFALGITEHERQSAYRALLHNGLDQKSLEMIRYATNNAWALGDETFKDLVATTGGRRARPLVAGRSKQLESDPD